MSNATVPAAPLRREEWDFSQVAKAELEDCFLWECARECGALIKTTVIRDSRVIDGVTIEPKIKSTGALSEKKQGRLQALALTFDLAIDQPWQLIPQPKRSLICGDQSAGIRPASSASVKLREQMEEQGSAGLDDAPHFAFSINWNESDNQLIVEFARWLQGNRPFDPRENRGSTTRDKLKMIGAMRLMHHYPFPEAFELTVSVLKFPLYGKRPSWERARIGARDAYREHFFDDWTKLEHPTVPRSLPSFGYSIPPPRRKNAP